MEIKRDWSDRGTVGQLLEYAARLKIASFDEIQGYARRYKDDPAFDLYAAFQLFAEGTKIRKEELARTHRVFIVAPESDDNLRLIVDWLKSFNVPVEFVPFAVYADTAGNPRFLQLEGINSSPDLVSSDDSWAGHWIFNTNETNARGAYKRMFDKGVAAIYGYANGPANLEGAAADEKVFAYVNQQGLRAIGTVVNPQVITGTGVFLDESGKQLPNEFHVKVRWEVVPEEQAISSADAAADFGYNLPVRSVFAKLHRGTLAQRLEQELRSRIASKKSAL